MLLVAASFILFTQVQDSSPYVLIAIGLVIAATGMGFAMAPASTAIVSSLPQSKAGVASAVNDVTRELGGALGIAILGTVLTSRFTTLMDDRLPAATPDAVRAGARTSIAAAIAIAGSDQVPSEFASALTDGARSAFTDSMNSAFVVSAVLLIVMAVVANRSVPKDMQVAAGH